MGIPVELFKEKVADEYMCPICLDVCDSPCAYACGHMHCRDCIRLSVREECSVCKVGIFSNKNP